MFLAVRDGDLGRAYAGMAELALVAIPSIKSECAPPKVNAHHREEWYWLVHALPARLHSTNIGKRATSNTPILLPWRSDGSEAAHVSVRIT